MEPDQLSPAEEAWCFFIAEWKGRGIQSEPGAVTAFTNGFATGARTARAELREKVEAIPTDWMLGAQVVPLREVLALLSEFGTKS